MLHHHVIVYGHIARGLVGHVHVVSLLDQAYERSAHRNHVVVRMRREYYNPLRERKRSHGAGAVVGIRLASRPAGNGVLEVVEDLDVNLVIRSLLFEQLAQRVVQIILVSEFQYRFSHLSAQPYHSLADHFLLPVAAAHKPRSRAARKQCRSVGVGVEAYIFVALQQGGRTHRAAFAFDYVLHCLSLALAPGHEYHLLCAQHCGYAHSYGRLRRGCQIAVEVAGLPLA